MPFLRIAFFIPTSFSYNLLLTISYIYNISQILFRLTGQVMFSSALYLKERFKWNYLAGFLLIIAAIFFVFRKREIKKARIL